MICNPKVHFFNTSKIYFTRVIILLPHHNIMIHIVTRVNLDDYLAQESLFLRYGYDNLEEYMYIYSVRFNVCHAELIIRYN